MGRGSQVLCSNVQVNSVCGQRKKIQTYKGTSGSSWAFYYFVIRQQLVLPEVFAAHQVMDISVCDAVGHAEHWN